MANSHPQTLMVHSYHCVGLPGMNAPFRRLIQVHQPDINAPFRRVMQVDFQNILYLYTIVVASTDTTAS